MLVTLTNIIYVLVAIAMTVLILLQRGAGASAGSGFGAGASATVFGARGSANFLSKSTAILATVFFVLSMGMAVYASRNANSVDPVDDLGVMGAVPVQSEVPASNSEVPTADAATPELPVTDSAADTAAEGAAVEAVAPESAATETGDK